MHGHVNFKAWSAFKEGKLSGNIAIEFMNKEKPKFKELTSLLMNAQLMLVWLLRFIFQKLRNFYTPF